MPYDHTKTQELLKILETRSLTTKERAQAREQIGLYYAKKLSILQERLFEAVEKRHTGALDPFEVDEYIHCYHKQSQELSIFMNSSSLSNNNLPGWLQDIDKDECGIRKWRLKTRLPHEEEEEEEEEEEA